MLCNRCLPWLNDEEGLALVKLGVSSGSAVLEPMRHDARVLVKHGNERVMS
jgi:hypothetical protein